MNKKWRSEWEEKMKIEEQKRREKWEGQQQKRRDEMEKKWRGKWDDNIKAEEQKRRNEEDEQRATRQSEWEANMRKWREEEHGERIRKEKTWLSQMKQRREDDKERAERNEVAREIGQKSERRGVAKKRASVDDQGKQGEITKMEQTLDTLWTKQCQLMNNLETMELELKQSPPSPLTPMVTDVGNPSNYSPSHHSPSQSPL